MFHVIARMQIKPEYFDEFMKIFKANVPTVLAEDGCLEYVPCLDFDTGAPIQEVDSLSMTVVKRPPSSSAVGWMSPSYVVR